MEVKKTPAPQRAGNADVEAMALRLVVENPTLALRFLAELRRAAGKIAICWIACCSHFPNVIG